jgi:hypothetical protein
MKKIWEFIKKNWRWLLVIPSILIMISWAFKWYVRMFVKKDDGKTDQELHQADVKFKQDTDVISEKEKKDIDIIVAERDKITTNIDKGDPNPSDVMNEFAGVIDEGSEKKK